MPRPHHRLAVRAGAGALLSVTLLGLGPAVAQAASDCPPGRTAAADRVSEPRFAGRTLHLSYDNGFGFELRFEGDRTAHWKVLAGQDPAEGTVAVDYREERPGVYRLKWTEADGTTVEQVQDWRSRTVSAVIETGSDGTRERIELRGTFKPVC
ncbi:MoaF N-terminal domain-containing protein [Streptomyces roseoverticillatus]|uniref:MoaF-related domain-containing protein n=1 Tax=Streptomyces roseoverticillatus TaxID=66429 RepID=UPI001F190C2F|nr:MoaF N-terminal domain-containing protein [Streptomyces roseoverticillatus]MCF3106118.1 MoaF N-terminal domain-containing protein [Streptomyces roseoverticillatus]